VKEQTSLPLSKKGIFSKLCGPMGTRIGWDQVQLRPRIHCIRTHRDYLCTKEGTDGYSRHFNACMRSFDRPGEVHALTGRLDDVTTDLDLRLTGHTSHTSEICGALWRPRWRRGALETNGQAWATGSTGTWSTLAKPPQTESIMSASTNLV
jgi:hypothetical protein